MEKIVMLGTGCAMVTRCYNTCFALSNNYEYLLVDTGGGNTILANLEKSNIKINQIHNVFISHSHNDHITGIVWIVRAVAEGILKNTYEGILNIYCHKDVINIIETICSLLLQSKHTKLLHDRILFKEIKHNSSENIIGYDIRFFDICSKKLLQFGFTTTLKSGKILTYLGDEPYSESSVDYAKNADYLMHEAYCLYSQRETFKPYEKSHSTVKDACENASKLLVKNIILYHTEDKNLPKRKELYTEEGKQYFNGEIIVPDDLETIIL